MKRDDGSVIAIITHNYQRMTEVERGIADFFLNNTEIMDFSAKNIAPKLFVSIPSLSRFAQKCGFQGYREFVYSYKQYLERHDISEKCELFNTIKLHEELLKEMRILLKEDQMERILASMLQTGRVLICGEGEIGLSASKMELRFMRMGINTIALTDAERMRLYAPIISADYMVIGMSINGIEEGVRHILKKAKGKGASTVMFTANPSDEMNDFCDEIICIPTISENENRDIISSLFLLGIIEDILYYYISNTWIGSENEDSQEKLLFAYMISK